VVGIEAVRLMFTREEEIQIIRIIEGEVNIYDYDELCDKLYEYYRDEMPYGTQKARDGDPYEWMFERMIDDFDYLVKVIELTEEDLKA